MSGTDWKKDNMYAEVQLIDNVNVGLNGGRACFAIYDLDRTFRDLAEYIRGLEEKDTFRYKTPTIQNAARAVRWGTTRFIDYYRQRCTETKECQFYNVGVEVRVKYFRINT